MSRLKKGEPEDGETWAGYVHIPMAEWADEELAAQLTSERLVTRWSKGFPKTFWKKTRARNEMLDCFVLNIAALRLLHPKLDLLAERLADPEASAPAKKPRNSARKSFLGKRRSGWLRRR